MALARCASSESIIFGPSASSGRAPAAVSKGSMGDRLASLGARMFDMRIHLRVKIIMRIKTPLVLWEV